MTEIEILRKADQIVRARMEHPMTEVEAQVFRETITGLLWIRTDITIAEATDLVSTIGRHAE